MTAESTMILTIKGLREEKAMIEGPGMTGGNHLNGFFLYIILDI